MILLQWTWTLRFGPYARATFATQPVLVALPLLGGVAMGLVVQDNVGTPSAVRFGLVVACVVTAAMVVAVARGLRRLRRAASATVQRYALTPDAIEIALGQDKFSVPLGELSITRSGGDWLALRRRAMGRRRLLLFFEDPALLPRARAIVEQHGAVSRS